MLIRSMVVLALGTALYLLPSFQTAERIVKTPEELQATIDVARPGQTIWLAAGTTYVGHFVLPAWRGGDERPVTIRTVGTEAVGAGERMTPERATRLAKLRSPDDGPVLTAAARARFWRIELVEFLPGGTGQDNIIALGSDRERDQAAAPSDLVLDRVYIHGDRTFGQRRGIALNSARTTISNSWISDIKAVGVDSQAIAGWNGPGDYLIENNYLEASGENIMFGGADPSIPGLVPTSIVIRGNTISKPLSWRQPGTKWEIKNLLELKNARRVTIENNLFERNWAQAQSGYAILFTVRNQEGNCPWCQVEDVQFLHNVIRDVAAGISILGQDDGYPSRQTNRITIAHNLIDGLDGAKWGGDGYLLQLLHSPRDVIVDHNTVIQGDSSGIAKLDSVVSGFTFTNNVLAHGAYGIISDNHAPGNDTISVSLPGSSIVSNVMAGGDSALYPRGNYFPSLADFRREFIDFSKKDFRLRTSSNWSNASTTGGPLGASADVLIQSSALRP